MIVERVGQIVDFHFRRFARVVNAAARVDEFAFGVENEEVRGPQRAVGPGHVLGRVVEIHPREPVGLHARLHVIEGILRIRVRAVGVDLVFDPAGDFNLS